MFKEVIIFIAGASIGGASVYYLLKNKFEKLSNDEIEAVRQYYWDKYPEKRSGSIDVHESSANEVSPSGRINTVVDYSKALNIARKNYVSYDRITAKPELGDHPEDDEPGDIYIIPFEQFESLYKSDGITLTWYEGDNVLVRPDESIVDIHEYIGDSLKAFNGNDKDAIYVRNEIHGRDYEVVRDEGNFSIDVLGEEDDD